MFSRRTLVRFSAAALCVALNATTALAGDGRALFKHLPKESPGLVVINLEQLNKSVLFQDVMRTLTANPEMKKAMDEARGYLGMDPMQAVKTVVMAFPTTPSGSDVVVAMEPALDAQKVMTSAVSTGKAKQQGTHSGVALYAGQAAGSGVMAVVGGHIVAGEADAVKKAIDQVKKKGPSIEKNSDLMKRFGGVKTSSDVTFVMKPTAEMRKTMQGESQKLEALRGGFDLEKGVAARVDVTFDNPQTATETVTQLKAGLTAMSSNPQAAMFGADIFAKKLIATTKGKDVNVAIDLDEADVARLKTMIGMLAAMGGMGGGGGAPGMMMPPPTQQP
ncbi:MAG: hypothetical protein ACOYM9_23265 [Bradymonadia bacterium]